MNSYIDRILFMHRWPTYQEIVNYKDALRKAGYTPDILKLSVEKIDGDDWLCAMLKTSSPPDNIQPWQNFYQRQPSFNRLNLKDQKRDQGYSGTRSGTTNSKTAGA